MNRHGVGLEPEDREALQDEPCIFTAADGSKHVWPIEPPLYESGSETASNESSSRPPSPFVESVHSSDWEDEPEYDQYTVFDETRGCNITVRVDRETTAAAASDADVIEQLDPTCGRHRRVAPSPASPRTGRGVLAGRSTGIRLES